MHRQFLSLLFLAAGAFAGAATSAERPNIVWLVTEDNSVDYLRLYTEGGAPMPNVERLAAHGLVFNHAFSNAPVCSAARSTIISGTYGPRAFSSFHRRIVEPPLPDGLRMFPAYLRRAGYYTANNAKTDYNFVTDPEAWDESSKQASYRNRKPGQPFFYVQNFEHTHEHMLHFTAEDMAAHPTVTDPATVTPFPFYPHTPVFRYTQARYLDLHREVDEEIGGVLRQLKADGLMDNTIIFYYGDNGGVLPDSKGYIYERGLHVPMVVYVPEKWRHLVPAATGTRIDGFVQFVDLAPTVLALAGVPIPEAMDGRPFLGAGVTLPELNARDTTFSYADRFDEKYDMLRGVRRGRFKYIRSYQPFNPDALYNQYRFRMLAYREWRDLYRAGKLNEVQSQFFRPRPAEELFDVEQDPFELHNLAGDPAHQDVLHSLRDVLRTKLKSWPDLGFFPEPALVADAAADPAAFGQSQRARISRLMDVADLNLQSFDAARPGIAAALASTDPWERYWGLVVCSSFGKTAADFADRARAIAKADAEPLVRVRADEFLGLTGLADPVPALTNLLYRSSTYESAVLILNSMVLLQDSELRYHFPLDRSKVPPAWFEGRASYVRSRFDYLSPKHQTTP